MMEKFIDNGANAGDDQFIIGTMTFEYPNLVEAVNFDKYNISITYWFALLQVIDTNYVKFKNATISTENIAIDNQKIDL